MSAHPPLGIVIVHIPHVARYHTTTSSQPPAPPREMSETEAWVMLGAVSTFAFVIVCLAVVFWWQGRKGGY